MKVHFKRKSLNEICSSLNAGLVDYKDSNKISIISDTKPGFLIRLVEVSLEEHMQHLVNCSPDIMKGEEFNVEVNSFDYFVFSMVIDEESGTKMLTNMPLFELVIASNNLLADETGLKQIQNSDWNMNAQIWDCLEQD